MKVLSVIPARGGSKGIPRKNIHPLAGKPLITHTIEQAQLATLVDRVVVSTDDVEIQQVSEAYGADVVIRPAEISGDRVSSEAALLHTLRTLADTEDYHPDVLVFLQCTSPLRLPSDIDGAIQHLIDSQADTLLAVMSFTLFLWREDETGTAIEINHDKLRRPMRQEIKRDNPQWLETGALYAMQVPGFLEAKHRFFGRTVLFEMPPERCLDINEMVDFRIAEVVLRERVGVAA